MSEENGIVVRMGMTLSPYMNPNKKSGSKLGHIVRNAERAKLAEEAMFRTREAMQSTPLPEAEEYGLRAYVSWEKGRNIWDDDNLIAGMKHVRDAIAKELGINDARMRWLGVTQKVNNLRMMEIEVVPL